MQIWIPVIFEEKYFHENGAKKREEATVSLHIKFKCNCLCNFGNPVLKSVQKRCALLILKKISHLEYTFHQIRSCWIILGGIKWKFHVVKKILKWRIKMKKYVITKRWIDGWNGVKWGNGGKMKWNGVNLEGKRKMEPR